jgi:Protein of unknown function (DUF3025)
MHTQLAQMTWLEPWWNPWRSVGQNVAARVLAGARVCDALNAQQQQVGMQFVPQTALPEGVAYEAFIFEAGQVPTRENLHDFFNGLAWLVFPHTKRRLNALQYGGLSAGGVQPTRGALRDALTLFDENAAMWPCANNAAPNTNATVNASKELQDALRAKQWQRAFIEMRAQWQTNPPVLFGHALLEKLVTPYKSITAHVYIAQTATDHTVVADLDTAVAAQLRPAELALKPFVPLPVLGVPGWWAANEDRAFYDDAQVFRAPRAIVL